MPKARGGHLGRAGLERAEAPFWTPLERTASFWQGQSYFCFLGRSLGCSLTVPHAGWTSEAPPSPPRELPGAKLPAVLRGVIEHLQGAVQPLLGSPRPSRVPGTPTLSPQGAQAPQSPCREGSFRSQPRPCGICLLLDRGLRAVPRPLKTMFLPVK